MDKIDELIKRFAIDSTAVRIDCESGFSDSLRDYLVENGEQQTIDDRELKIRLEMME